MGGRLRHRRRHAEVRAPVLRPAGLSRPTRARPRLAPANRRPPRRPEPQLLARRAMSLRRSDGLYTAAAGTRPCPTTQGGGLKLLLTSGGIKNASIRDALV